MAERFRLVFAGDVLEGHAAADVRRQMAALLRLPEAREASMFSGKRTVLKRRMSFEEATRYAARFEQVGARVHIEAESAPAPAPVPADTPPRAPASARPPVHRTVVIARAAAVVAVAIAAAGVFLGDGGSPFAPRPSDTRLSNYGLSDDARAAFHANYWPAGGNKAFAASTGGAFGLASGASSDQEAAQRALAACDGRRAPGTPACRLVDLTGSWAPVTP